MSTKKSSYFSRKTELLRQKITEYWHTFNQWFVDTSARALLEAYQAAQNIKNAEIEHFGGQKISPQSRNYTENVMSYWQGHLDRNLAIIKVRLGEFQLSRSLVNNSDPILLEKLTFIDEVITKYTPNEEQISKINRQAVNNQSDSSNDIAKVPSLSQKNGILPRSIDRTINKIVQDFSPKTEERFLKDYRKSRNRTRITIKFLLILIIVPLLTQQFSKNLLINPIVERMRGENITQIFLNSDMEEEAFHELKSFEEELKFESLLHLTPKLSPTAIEKEIKDKAIEIAKEFRKKSSAAISNVFADLISLIAFSLIIAFSKKEIVVVKSFIDQIVYGLSDSAKAFIIILFTDIFVGFHSPHGWEILLEGLAEHLGIAASRSGIFLFIATFPVILDTIVKYWIFRYLSRLSPSALATLKEMDE
ncbi:CemA family protein [Cylindrospermum sp. NIES-4074]|nr:CemA family protein [Cylindrospermum sp. NIES-4074]